MRKTVIRFLPRSYWEFGEIENWLSDMAKKGLLLKKIWGNYVTFFKAEPLQLKYRIDFLPGTQEQTELYSANGWYLVTYNNDYSVYASLAENNAPELHTDPAEQAYSMNRLLKSQLTIAGIYCLFLTIMSALWFTDRSYVQFIMEGDFNLIIMIGIYGFLLFQGFRALTSIIKLKRKLSEGKPINHSAPWKKKRTIRLIVFSVFFGFMLFIMTINAVSFWSDKTKELSLSDSSLPIVRLADIEQNSDLIRGPSDLQEGIDINNHGFVEKSYLAPAQYRTFENGLVLNEKWKTGSAKEGMTYSPELETKMFELRYASMNEWVLSWFINRFASVEGEQLTEISNQGFDKLLVYKAANTIELFAAKEEYVIWLVYYGNADLDTVIEAVADKIDKISD